MRSVRCPAIHGVDRCVLDAGHPGPHQLTWESERSIVTAATRIQAAGHPGLESVLEQVLALLEALADYADTLAQPTQIQTAVREPITQGQRTIPRSHS